MPTCAVPASAAATGDATFGFGLRRIVRYRCGVRCCRIGSCGFSVSRGLGVRRNRIVGFLAVRAGALSDLLTNLSRGRLNNAAHRNLLGNRGIQADIIRDLRRRNHGLSRTNMRVSDRLSLMLGGTNSGINVLRISAEALSDRGINRIGIRFPISRFPIRGLPRRMRLGNLKLGRSRIERLNILGRARRSRKRHRVPPIVDLTPEYGE